MLQPVDLALQLICIWLSAEYLLYLRQNRPRQTSLNDKTSVRLDTERELSAKVIQNVCSCSGCYVVKKAYQSELKVDLLFCCTAAILARNGRVTAFGKALL